MISVDLPVVKHVLVGGVNAPRTPLVTRPPGHLDKTVVQSQIVADGAVPFLVLSIVREPEKKPRKCSRNIRYDFGKPSGMYIHVGL